MKNMNRIRKAAASFRGARGFSLAELLVSVAIFSITVVAIVSVLRTGNELSTTDGHRKRARAVMDSCFESASYQPSNYSNLASVARAVLIDARDPGDAGDDLTGSLRITVAVVTDNSTGIQVEYKRVNLSVSWQEPEAVQTLTLEKIITDIAPL
jgi:prepilin-type N-terminal cleavage/methylation domain-containing protein